jgi:SAM-dependent methyltransferase
MGLIRNVCRVFRLSTPAGRKGRSALVVACRKNVTISLVMPLNTDLAVDSVEWYNLHAESVVERHESIRATDANAWLQPELPGSPAHVLDVGAGSGRDAAWLSSLGYKVVAVEPSSRMAAHARRLGRCPDIEWIDDRLPRLAKLKCPPGDLDSTLSLRTRCGCTCLRANEHLRSLRFWAYSLPVECWQSPSAKGRLR